jgi:hypothetical protein
MSDEIVLKARFEGLSLFSAVPTNYKGSLWAQASSGRLFIGRSSEFSFGVMPLLCQNGALPKISFALHVIWQQN